MVGWDAGDGVTDHIVPDTAPAEVLPALDDTDSVEFAGRRYRLADSLPLIPLMRFAHAQANADTDPVAFLGHAWTMISKLIAAEQINDWAAHAERVNPDITDLLQFIQDAIGVVSARPTPRSSASPDGPQTTKQNSLAGSISRGSSTRWTPPAPVPGSGLAKDERILAIVADAS